MAHNKLAAIVLAFTVAVCATLVLGAHFTSAQTDNILIGTYLYTWYGIGFNDHWVLDDIKGTPSLGYFNSSDPTIAEQQILLAKQHGIDFLAVSWAGKGEWDNWDYYQLDYNLRNGLLNATQLNEFHFCLFYETVLVLDKAKNLNKNFSQIFVEDMNYSLQYLEHPRYLRLNGDPVLFIYNVPYLYQNMNASDVHHLLDYVRQQAVTRGVSLYIIGDLGNGPEPPEDSDWYYYLNATTSYLFNGGCESWIELLQNTKNFYPLWRSTMASKGIDFVPNVYPGFNNTNNRGVELEDWKVLPRNVSAFREMLQTALSQTSSTPGFVMVTSWNEWMENTQIEPSIEEGELFLNALLTPTPTPPSTATLHREVAIYAIAATAIAILAVTAAVLIKKHKNRPKRKCQPTKKAFCKK